MLCIWYLFLWIASFRSFESSAILTLLSFLTVITTGPMKYSSEHFSSLIICLSSISFSNSCSPVLLSVIGLVYLCVVLGVNFSLKVDFATWFFERPRRVHRCGYFFNIHFMMFCSVDASDIKPMVLPVGFVAVK